MDIISKFNLPKYIKGKSFAEASSVIAKKFENRNSPEDVATLNELQSRLQQAQEYVKAEQEKKTKPSKAAQSISSPEGMGGAEPSGSELASNPNNQYALGGLLGMLGGAGAGAGAAAGAAGAGAAGAISGGAGAAGAAGAASKIPGIGSVIGAAGTALDLANTAFGKPNVDTTGATPPPEMPSQGAMAAQGAMKGMSAGASFGPIGAGVGAIVGGAAGLIGGKKGKDAEAKASYEYTSKLHNDASNSYRTGGPLGSGIGSLVNMFVESQEGDVPDLSAVMDNKTNLMRDTEGIDVTGIRKKNQQFEEMGLDSDSIDAMELEDETAELTEFADSLDDGSKSANTNTSKNTNTKKGGFNPAELLRYAPAAMNIGQLAGLKKPEQIALARLGNKYEKQLVDEKGLQNTVQGSVNNMRDAITNASGGDAGGTRASLLASQLQGTKALSSAYQQATEANRNESRREQEFDLGVDRQNLQQGNLETNLNLEQEAAYQTNKSKLLSQIGDNLGDVGREEMFKKYPELIGLGYDSKGNPINRRPASQRSANTSADTPNQIDPNQNNEDVSFNEVVDENYNDMINTIDEFYSDGTLKKKKENPELEGINQPETTNEGSPNDNTITLTQEELDGPDTETAGEFQEIGGDDSAQNTLYDDMLKTLESDVNKATVGGVKAEPVEAVVSNEASPKEKIKAKEIVQKELDNPEKAKETIDNIVEKEDDTISKNPLNIANKYLGFDETNIEHQNTIKGFLDQAVPGFVKNKSDVAKDSSAWCAAFVNSIIKEGSFEDLNDEGDKYNLIRAKAYQKIGSDVGGIDVAKPGDVVVVRSKDSMGYHVAFYSGRKNGRHLMLGGNQNNRVSVKEIDEDLLDIVSVRRLNGIQDIKTANLEKIINTEFYDTADKEAVIR